MTTPAEVHHRVRVAANQISAARKQALSMYDADLRLLRDLDLKLSSTCALNEPELIKVETILSPEARELISAPLAKYQ